MNTMTKVETVEIFRKTGLGKENHNFYPQFTVV